MLEIRHLKKYYGDLCVYEDFSLSAEDGKTLAVLGASGAGKTTLLNIAAGLLPFDGGEIFGRPERVSYVFQSDRLVRHMTVLENLKIGAYLRKDDLSEDLEWVYSLFPRLKERSWQAGGTLSGGEQQMLAVGRALMSRPKLLMMDEPSLGLAPLVVRDIFSIIQEINKQGVTILLIEQNANMALKIADIGYVLETGRITLTGSGEELLTNDAVRAAYLGA